MAKTTHMGAQVNNASSETTGCKASGCRKSDAQFGFCAEHFDHFKFGLINRKGKKVPDYDKKFDHYVAMQQRTGVIKKAA